MIWSRNKLELKESQKNQGWHLISFDKVAKIRSERIRPSEEDSLKYIGLEHLQNGRLDIKRWGSEIPLKGDKLVMKKGDILFGKRNAYLKRISISPIDGIFSAHGMIINPYGTLILKDYLPFMMQSNMFMNRAISISEGSLSPTIKWKTLARQKFPIPPIEIQAKYINIFEAARNTLIALDDSISELITLKRIIISNLFSINNFEKDNIKIKKFSEVTELINGLIDPKLMPYKKLPHIAPDNIEQKTGRLLNYKTAEEDGVKSGKFHFDELCILYSKIRPNLRKICIPGFEGICSSDVFPIKGRNGLLTNYLFYLMQSEHFNQYAINVSRGNAFPRINRDDLFEYKLRIPSESYQRKIIKTLNEIDKEYELLLKHGDKLTSYNQQIIDRLIN